MMEVLDTKRRKEEAWSEGKVIGRWGAAETELIMSEELGEHEKIYGTSKVSVIKWKKPVCPEGVECKIVEMSPLEYLSKVPSPCREGVTADKDVELKGCFSESSIRYITKQIERGEELDVPFLDYERMFRGFPTHEGRHRAFVAYKMGAKRIPVVVLGKGNLGAM